MVKLSYSNSSDQYDQKVFRETLGTFGTTTIPGGDQLQELQTKVRQGVKHVELHLASGGKGQFNAKDTPDKYGQEQRRTIMQLAKLNNQSLSVHATFDVTSFSGITQGGFDQSQRLNSIKEIDETLSFAAATAKGGAVVMHMQGDAISNDKSELNLSKKYIDWLKENRPDEFKRINEEYFDANPLNRKFINNPLTEIEVKEEYEKLKGTDKYNQFEKDAKTSNRDAWELYYMDKNIQKQKLSPDRSPLVLVGDKIEQTARQQDFLNLDYFNNTNKLTSQEKKNLQTLGISVDHFNIEDMQKAQAIFSNGFPDEYSKEISPAEYNNLKNKLLVTYESVLKENYNLQAQADKEFHKKLLDFQIKMMGFQKDDLDTNYIVNEEYLEQIKGLTNKERVLAKEISIAKNNGDNNRLKELRQELNGGELSDTQKKEMEELQKKFQNPNLSDLEKENIQKRAEEIQMSAYGIQMQKNQLMQKVGQVEYQKLEKYDEMTAQINDNVKKLKEQKDEVKAVTDEILDKNTSALAHLGLKAMKYQLDLKDKSKTASVQVKKLASEIQNLKDKYEKSFDYDEKNKINFEIQKLKSAQSKVVGMSDYSDIDMLENPLYIAPENMLPGMGSITSIEEFKAALRMGQLDFADRILGNESEYKEIKKRYEKETGIKIKTKEDAMKLAKRHVAGTFDNAHAAGWLKHFKSEKGESEEHKIDRFNNWLNTQAEDMVKEGLVKHIHFNDSMGKDDDHNMLGTGVLDIHDLRDRLRRAGVKEALIVEAGGRSGHLNNAFDMFNPALQNSNPQYKLQSNVSDWISVNNTYNNRLQYSHYGMNYNTFKHQPQQGQFRGEWSNTDFF